MFKRSWIRLALATLPMTLFVPACTSSKDEPPVNDAGAGSDGAGSQGTDTVPSGMTDTAAATDTVVATDTAAATDTVVATDTAAATDTVVATDTAAINCSALALVNSAPEIEGVRVAETRPAPTGGTLVPGLYHYTASRNYTGPGGATGGVNSFFKQTIKIDSLGGGKFAVEMVDSERGAHTNRRVAGTATTAGTQLNYQITCPGMMAISVGFEADGTSYKTWNANDNKIHVYTKQP
jgi:hypothetical protein